MNLLYITSFIPQKNASQAGINVSYNLIETIKKEFDFNIDVLGVINENQSSVNCKDINEIANSTEFLPINKKGKIKNIFSNIKKPLIMSVRNDNRLKKIIVNKLKSTNYDFIILDYTQNMMYIEEILKTNFKGKIISVEHDVSFLSFERKVDKEKNLIKKLLYTLEYNRLKKAELMLINKFDYILTLNEKDAKLIPDNSNVKVINPYIKRNNTVKKKHKGFNIMFWGAMNRLENENAVTNFMKNIWPLVDKENTKFYIVGANPSKKILNLKSENIIVTGFVEDPNEYFEIMDLSVTPLLLGAGIKIKVLESLAAKIAVITTNVGAEGIGIINSEHAYVTDDNKEFAKKINLLKLDKNNRNYIEEKGYELIKNKYSLENNRTVLKDIFKN
ncbi:glycosyltransferase [Clostridium gasigenes]|uniref:glycosyltransferase n=1 Tax=Clostridium gasigenes TaxID=94869 RepID=UPI00143869FA|nr:glycosyltransferase [Clostridium gasigenes]NKF07429.1 glycosyltransferase [Clostridium gasigenes]QSW17871.1 glycosyltransferase [Clostridium gasigenes]